MAMTDGRLTRSAERPDPVAPPGVTPRGFRPGSRRRARIAAGATLAAIGIGGNVLLYTSLDDTTEVVQVTGNIRAGQLLDADDLRIVEVELDATVPFVPADQIGSIVGQYASVYIPAGTLLVDVLVRPDPLVAPGQGVVAVEIRPTQVPYGVLERSRVQLVVVGDDATPIFTTEGRVVSVIGADAEGSEDGSMSVEVAEADAALVAAADDVRVVLLDPGIDPAMPAAGDTADAVVQPAASPTPTPAPTSTEGAAPSAAANAATATTATTLAATTAAPTVPAAPAPTVVGATAP